MFLVVQLARGLGLKGPSMTCDTDGSSSLTAVHLGGEAVLTKGHGVSNECLPCIKWWGLDDLMTKPVLRFEVRNWWYCEMEFCLGIDVWDGFSFDFYIQWHWSLKSFNSFASNKSENTSKTAINLMESMRLELFFPSWRSIFATLVHQVLLVRWCGLPTWTSVLATDASSWAPGRYLLTVSREVSPGILFKGAGRFTNSP